MACKKKQVIRSGAFLIQPVCISLLLMVVDGARMLRDEKEAVVGQNVCCGLPSHESLGVIAEQRNIRDFCYVSLDALLES